MTALDDYIDLGERPVSAEIADLETTLETEYSCPDCGYYTGRYYGPVDFDGQRYENGDYVCRSCAINRGVIAHG